ncbi:MAG: hypothetical protein R3F51_17495 [Cyanobacteriota/Melainabacteria group bacterium]
MPVYLNNPIDNHRRAVEETALSENSLKKRFGIGSILVGLVIAGVALNRNPGRYSACRQAHSFALKPTVAICCYLPEQRSVQPFIDRAYYAVRAVAAIAGFTLKSIRQKELVEFSLEPTEKVSLLFWTVKLIFIPFLLSATNQADHLVPIFTSGKLPELLTSFPMFYIIWLAIINLLDTVVATLGYAIESKSLGNEVRSVDTSIIGWLAVLCCYPPCWVITSTLIPINASPFFSASVDNFVDISVRVLILVFLTLFTVATFNLNVHFSNLCHRGLVTSGLYSIVRHPAYTCKLISWGLVIAYLSGSNLTMWCHYLAWIALYGQI